MTKTADRAREAFAAGTTRTISSSTKVVSARNPFTSDRPVRLYLHGHCIVASEIVAGIHQNKRFTFAGWPTLTTLDRLSSFVYTLHLVRLAGAVARDYTPSAWGVPFPDTEWVSFGVPEPLLWLPGKSEDERRAYTVQKCTPLFEQYVRGWPAGLLRERAGQVYQFLVDPPRHAFGGMLTAETQLDIISKEVQRRGPSLRRKA